VDPVPGVGLPAGWPVLADAAVAKLPSIEILDALGI